MGQYYRAMVKKQNGRIDVYNRNVVREGKEELTFAKLTEHSWWYNDFVNAVCLDVYSRKEKNRIAWIGDYAHTFLRYMDLKSFNGLNQRQIKRLSDRCWKCKGRAVELTDFTLDGLFLINHTKKQYVDCNKFYKDNVTSDEWCVHPLPFLTCIGNGLGGGDYTNPTDNSTEEYVGAWAWNEISIADKPVEDYSKIFPIFKEKGWD